MTDPTTATKAAAASTRAASSTAAKAVDKALPTVVETAELAVEVPARVLMNQRVIVIASVAGGAVLGAGVLFGVNKLRAHLAERKIQKQVEGDPVD